MLAAYGGFQAGSRISEVKTALIYTLDDTSTLIAFKKQPDSANSKHLYDVLKARSLWRCEELQRAYQRSKFKWMIEFDGEVERGFGWMEERKKEL
jgi:hypothetical protein